MRKKLVIAFGIPVVYGMAGVGLVKGYHGISTEMRSKVPYPVWRLAQFYEANYRVIRCGYAMGSIFTEYSIRNYQWKSKENHENLSRKERDEFFHPTYSRGAKRALRTLEDLGGVFIKLGQELSLMRGLIPDEYIQEMTKLQDNVPSISYAEVRSAFQRSFGKEIEECFSSFEKEPVAAASLAQVHRATLLDGTEVAVKVKYPRVSNFIDIDLTMHTIFTELYAYYEPKFHIDPEARNEIQSHLKLELDLSNEARNAKKM